MQLDHYFTKADMSAIGVGKIFIIMETQAPILAIMLERADYQQALLLNLVKDGKIVPPSKHYTRNLNQAVYAISNARIRTRRNLEKFGPVLHAEAHALTLYLDGEAAFIGSHEQHGLDLINVVSGASTRRNRTEFIACSEWAIVIDGPNDTPEVIFQVPA